MAEEGQVIGVHSVEAWKEHIEKGKGSNKLVSFPKLAPFICFRVLIAELLSH